jgi:hypothetical protein
MGKKNYDDLHATKMFVSMTVNACMQFYVLLTFTVAGNIPSAMRRST